MGLAKYRQKRKFAETPEPSGKVKGSSKQLQFVIQKHDATRLHYDLRLEMDGVMLSWAVPKGPSLNPSDKRMAMQVEDHPMDYNTFEGTIPQGNYGAGTVMVWDRGTYGTIDGGPYEQQRKELKHGYQSGDFKFRLHGEKLSGTWVLVKTKGYGKNSWLLIKKEDDAASKADVTNKDRSVKTGRTMHQIAKGAAAKGQVWESNRQTDEAAPPKGVKRNVTDVKPMLAKLVDAPFDRAGWLFETKWDGYRAVAEVKRQGKPKLYSRNGVSFVDDYPPVVKALQQLGHDAVLDGEVVVLDRSGRSSFQKLQDYRRSGKGDIRYAGFDLLALDGYDIRKFTLRDRKELLKELISGVKGLVYSDHVEQHGVKAFEQAVKKGEEGIIAKDATSPYRDGSRGGEWLKVKSVRRQEAVIGGFTQGRGSRKGFGALLLGVYDGDDFVYIGHTGSGFDEATIKELHPQLQKLTRKSSPFSEEPKPNMPVTWVSPQLICEVKFQEWTNDGHLRQPIYLGVREDKHPKEVQREGAEAPVTAAKNVPDEQAVKVDRHVLKLTHLNKVFWPDEDLAKGDLIAYYDQVAETILPYLKDRPESLNRHPNGINGKSFYQKDVKDLPPSWVKTQLVYSESNQKNINYLVCQDRATLLYLANLGCIELHPWHSRVKALEKPDYLLIDLDAKTASFRQVVEVAQAMRELLQKIDVPSYPKTSGKSGLHICVPLGARYDYEQAKQFTEILMHFVHAQLPEVTSLERKPDKREGQIYLDYLQNRHGQTMAAPYCVRPVSGAHVSAPLSWDEVDQSLDPADYTIRTMNDRIRDVGDLWQPVLGKGIALKQALTKLEKLID